MLSEIWSSLSREPDALAAADSRVIPIGDSPFRSREVSEEYKLENLAPGPLAKETEEVREEEDTAGPPQWLGIFFDLAWTTTFSNLVQNTNLTSISTIWSYAVYFLLSWWLWATQVLYDTRFYRNDYFHRFMLLIQLGTFATLSSFTQNFNPFAKNYDPNTDIASYYQVDDYTRKANLGISGMFALSRLMLAISYARLIWYAPRGMRLRRFLVSNVVGYTVSALLFTAAFIAVDFYHVKHRAFITVVKLLLWLAGILVELAVFAIMKFPNPKALRNEDTLTERLSTLTSIILGEGLNSIAQTLVFAASSIGFSLESGLQAAAATAVIAFSFALYFEGFRSNIQAGRRRAKWHLVLHLPLHLFLILMLEGIRNIILITSLEGSWSWFLYNLQPRGSETLGQALVHAFRLVGIEFSHTLAIANLTIDNASDGQLRVAASALIPQALLNLLAEYNIPPSNATANLTSIAAGDMLFNITTLNNDPMLLETTPGVDTILQASSATIMPFVSADLAAGVWLPLAAGGFLAVLAWITLVNEWIPSHRYIWGSVFSRVGTAIVVILVSFIHFVHASWDIIMSHRLLVPIVAGAYIWQFIMDQFLVSFAARRRARRAGSTSTYQQVSPS